MTKITHFPSQKPPNRPKTPTNIVFHHLLPIFHHFADFPIFPFFHLCPAKFLILRTCGRTDRRTKHPSRLQPVIRPGRNATKTAAQPLARVLATDSSPRDTSIKVPRPAYRRLNKSPKTAQTASPTSSQGPVQKSPKPHANL